jgi:hypothetical protein
MGYLLLRLFRVGVLLALLVWAVEAGDLSNRARAFVETRLAGWGEPVDR